MAARSTPPREPAVVPPALAGQPPSSPAPPQAAVVEQARTPAPPQRGSAAFAYHEPEARQVSWCGECNGWSPKAKPMKRQAERLWVTTLALRPGRYQYKFVVDGQWVPDPNAQAVVHNGFGSVNAVIEVQG